MNTVAPTHDNKRAGRKYEFKPIDISPYSFSTFFRLGGRVLLMSATIVNKDIFCQSLGLEPDTVAYLSIPSPFPVENRPVHFLPVGSMSKFTIDQTLPKMAEVVKMLLEKHQQEKGIIHCVNFKVAKFIKEHVGSDRLMLHDSSNREDVLKHHIKSDEPTVLLSPSMIS